MSIYPVDSKIFLRNSGIFLIIAAVGHFIAYKIVHIPVR